MGLLDDAIREHLELKRRSGADARQLAQLEHEAFGPIRRGDPALDIGPAAAGAVPEETEPVEDEYVYEDAPPPAIPVEDDIEWDEPAAPEPGDEPRWEDDPVAQEPDPLPLPVPEADPVFPLTPAAPPEEVEEAWEEAAEAEHLPPVPEASAPVEQPTAAFSLDDLEALESPAAEHPAPAVPDEPPTQVAPIDVVPADDEPGEHDVLEETPEFLEETPEHDRLWFEQKPPKDFDF
jgi:hypothetical protein